MIVQAQETTVEAQDKAAAKPDTKWRPLAQKWENANFGGDGPIDREPVGKADDGAEKDASGKKLAKSNDTLIRLGMGDPLTGIRWAGDLPRENYELRLQARRTDGFDFFAAVTFPVGKEEKCSFVLGGWGGGIVGISSIDGNDASSNSTTGYKDFENDQWYSIRIRVDEQKVMAWIDDKEWASVDRAEHTFDIRIEMDPCLPLGIANFQCTSEIRGVEIRSLEKPSQP